MKEHSDIKVEISQKTILFTLAVIAGTYLLFLLKDVAILLFISFMVSVAISPLVVKLKARRIPENLSIGIAYILMVAGLTGIIAGIIPPLINETTKLFSQVPIPESIASDIRTLNIDFDDLNALASQMNTIPKVLSFIGSAFAIVTILLTVAVMSVYLIKERKDIHKNLVFFFGKDHTEKQAEAFVDRIEDQIGGWVRGEFMLMFIVGLLTYFGLVLLGINFAVPLAIIAGLLEVLPNIGPTISAIPAIILAYLTSSPTMAGAVAALYILIQQIENSFIVPIVMKKTVGINPITTIILILVGYQLGGVGGSALAIPLFLTIKVFLKEILKVKRSKFLN